MKKTMWILILLALVMLLAGCKKEPTPETTVPTQTAEPTEITAVQTVPETTEQTLPTDPTAGIPILPPETTVPETDPPATEPPVTESPATQPPVTQPAATEPPATDFNSGVEDELPFIPAG